MITEIGIVITDIVMPEKDGLDVATALREKHPPVKIVAISGAGDRAEDHLDLGAMKALLKPFTPAAMIAAIDELLSGDR